MPIPQLTRSIGTAERSLRALLEQRLQKSMLSFSEWTVLVFTNATKLTPSEAVQRQLAGHIVDDASQAEESISSLTSKGLIVQTPDDLLAQTPKGIQLFKPLAQEIENLTHSLYSDLPMTDLEVTHRILTEIASRAAKLLGR